MGRKNTLKVFISQNSSLSQATLKLADELWLNINDETLLQFSFVKIVMCFITIAND